MLIVNYSSKKEMRENIGKRLDYTETSMFGDEYLSDGTFFGSNRPSLTNNKGREFYAQITMENNLIKGVA